MLRFFAAALLALPLVQSLATAAPASETGIVPASEPDPARAATPSGWRSIGYGRLTTNDLFGDGGDRWRTGSITSSRVWGRGPWTGTAPGRFGDLLEFRTQGEIIAPVSLRRVNPADRPWAGKLSFGLHSHWSRARTEYSLGGDLVFVGPWTGLGTLQRNLHRLVGAPIPGDAVLGRQIGNTVRPTIVGEVGHSYPLWDAMRLRPFAEARAGDETLLRIGADLSIGAFGTGELMVRESVTGQRYRAVRNPAPGLGFLLGADIARVFDSIYLPADRGLRPSRNRRRVRAGVHWQGENASFFYGATWLGGEFQGQPGSQVVGSIRVQFQF